MIYFQIIRSWIRESEPPPSVCLLSDSNHALGLPNGSVPRRRSAVLFIAIFLLLSSWVVQAVDYVRIPLANGFDFPVGKPNSAGYYKARGYHPKGHHGEDWNGKGGGNTDLGDSVYACGDGVVVQSRDVRVGWGNVVIIRHHYRDPKGKLQTIDSLYGHLNARYVTLHQRVKRGQRIGTIGTNRGMYLAHLHFEIRKNIYIGMHRSKFARGYGNYWDPTYFIKTHRQCKTNSGTYKVPINTFQPYPSGSRDVVSKKPPRGAEIAKVVKAKSIVIPVERTKRTAVKTTYKPSGTHSNTTRYMDSGTQRRTLSPASQRIVAQEKKSSTAKPANTTERKTIWSRLKQKVKSSESSPATKTKKTIGRRRGLFNRR